MPQMKQTNKQTNK